MTSSNKVPSKNEISSKLTIDELGNKYWYNDQNQLHREDGPAYESIDGIKSWWINDRNHRENGPSIIFSDGSEEWRINGRMHRIDGPAVNYSNGYKEWYYYGQYINCKSQEEFERIIELIPFE